MKTAITLLFVATIIVFCTACTAQKSNSIEVDLFKDVTDKFIAMPDPNEVISLYNLDNIYNGGVFRITIGTAVSYNPENELKIESANQWLSNELEREQEISNFKQQITDRIINANKTNSGKSQSSLYFPIANMLNELSTHKITQRRYMLIYSDLMENSNTLSFYNKKTLNLLVKNPELISKYLTSQVSLNNLQGITIYVIYQPVNTKQDERFKIVSEFYKKMFQAKGAIVKIGANLN